MKCINMDQIVENTNPLHCFSSVQTKVSSLVQETKTVDGGGRSLERALGAGGMSSGPIFGTVRRRTAWIAYFS